MWPFSSARRRLAKAGLVGGIEMLCPADSRAAWGRFSRTQLERFARENSVVGACLSQICRSVTEAPLGVVRRGSSSISFDGPAVALIDQPNTEMDGNELLKHIVLHQFSTGASYTRKLRQGAALTGLFPLPTSWISPDYDRLGLPYRYALQGLPGYVPAGDMAWSYFPSPNHPLEPLSPIEQAGREVITDQERTDYLYEMMRNAVTPGMILFHDSDWSPKKVRRSRDKIQMATGGTHRGGILAIPDENGRARVELPTPLKDLDWPGLAGLCETRICACLGVSPILIHLRSGREAATYANYAEAAQMFYRGTMVSLWKMIERSFTRAFLVDEGVFNLEYRFDLSQVEYLKNTAEVKVA